MCDEYPVNWPKNGTAADGEKPREFKYSEPRSEKKTWYQDHRRLSRSLVLVSPMSQHVGKRKNADGIAGGVLLTVLASVPSLPGRRQWRPMPLSCRFGKYLANKALDQAPDGEMPATVPIPPSQSHYIAGARIYKENSALCHALPPATARQPRPFARANRDGNWAVRGRLIQWGVIL